jgi:hypothetical protein
MPCTIVGAQKLAPNQITTSSADQVEPVARGQQQRLAADLAVELAEGNQRAEKVTAPIRMPT